MRASLAAVIFVGVGCSFGGAGHAVSDGGGIDATLDGPRDASGDATQDAPADAAPDAPADAAPDAMVDASPPDARTCPAGYSPIAGGPAASSYRVVGGVTQWRAAEVDCEDDGFGTHLAVIDDAAEMAAVDVLQTGAHWVGASDRITEGAFLAVTGGPALFLPWDTGQPNNAFGQDCVEASENGLFNDLQCGAFRQFVCECDGVPADPAAF
jgi:hypothetical protein